MTRPLLLVVAAALFDASGRILLAQRPPGKALAGLWEFPGGKVEAGESPEAALVRELHEELGIVVKAELLEPLKFASYGYPEFHLLMPLFGCRSWSGTIRSGEGQSFAWVAPDQLHDYPAPPADIPLFDWLAQRVRTER